MIINTVVNNNHTIVF